MTKSSHIFKTILSLAVFGVTVSARAASAPTCTAEIKNNVMSVTVAYGVNIIKKNLTLEASKYASGELVCTAYKAAAGTGDPDGRGIDVTIATEANPSRAIYIDTVYTPGGKCDYTMDCSGCAEAELNRCMIDASGG